MSSGAKVGLGIFMIFMVIGIGGALYVNSAYDTAGTKENAVIAQDESMQNTWGQTEQMLKMSGVTVKNYGETFIKSLKANAERYKNDKGAMMKWVQEAQSQLSPALHQKLMTTIEKVYAKKEARQLSKISVVQDYRDFINFSMKGKIAKAFFDYPSAKATKIMDRIVSTKATKQTWETGTEEAPTDLLN